MLLNVVEQPRPTDQPGRARFAERPPPIRGIRISANCLVEHITNGRTLHDGQQPAVAISSITSLDGASIPGPQATATTARSSDCGRTPSSLLRLFWGRNEKRPQRGRAGATTKAPGRGRHLSPGAMKGLTALPLVPELWRCSTTPIAALGGGTQAALFPPLPQHHRAKSFLKRKDADAWARDMEVRADRSDLPADTSILKTLRLSDLIDRYCKEVTPQKRGARVEDAVLARILLDPICRVPLSQLGPSDFARDRERRLVSIAPTTLKRQLNPIQHMFEVAPRPGRRATVKSRAEHSGGVTRLSVVSCA
ncbi:hypothetical protein SAMN05216337_104660 [Bradyrhizobium brasilense]|uniref:Uncharacterized protein n=1 Tax=Bradyrhizobium brasilense TaxID=1419277 RepID=A0A1G7IX74_9BRAD|nr:hypothetical protein SAMN05216337_104660 [Bradyrhizobium brasilense]